jgi:pilus assembly protein Flp/PilA
MHNLVSKFTPEASVEGDDAGLTMVEYAVAGSLITLAAVAAFTTLGTTVAGKIGQITTSM